jgi:hypothetical protein
MMAFEHPNAKSQWTTIEFPRNGRMETVLVIETDLATMHTHPGYDVGRLQDLEQAIADYVTGPQDGHIDRVRLVSIKSDNDAQGT